MNAITNVEPAAHPLVKLKTQFIDRQAEFHAGLPAHIPVERFIRVILTACQLNPELLKADRASLFTSAMKAATDGLLPDNREGALVIYKTKVANEWIAKVSWMPMIAGIRKKVRNSDTIATWDVHTVHEKDHFQFELGDDPFIKHRPFLGDRGAMVAVYSVAVLKSGEKTRDVMSRSEVDYVRDTYSKRDRDGKFSGAWIKSYDEMAKKTVARRHSKVLPMSTDLDDLLRRDDELYDLEGKSDKRLTAPPKTLGARLDALADVTNGDPEPQAPADPEIGEYTDNPSPSPHTDLREEAAADASPVERRAGSPTIGPEGDPAPVPHEQASGDEPDVSRDEAGDGGGAGGRIERSDNGADARRSSVGSKEPGAAAPRQWPLEGVAASPPGAAAPSLVPRKAEIRRDGDARAAAGTAALSDYLDGLRKAGEADLVSTVVKSAWSDAAKAADAAMGRK